MMFQHFRRLAASLLIRHFLRQHFAQMSGAFASTGQPVFRHIAAIFHSEFSSTFRHFHLFLHVFA